MTLVDSQPSVLICFTLELLNRSVTNTTEFTFKAEGSQTLVTWKMFGTHNFIGTVVSLFMNCDVMVGGQFGLGLAAMNAIVEEVQFIGWTRIEPVLVFSSRI